VFNYQFNYFFRNGFAESKPERIGEFMLAFDNKFLPSFVDEVTPTGTSKMLRMVGFDKYSIVSILFGSEVISIHVNTKDENKVEKQVLFELLSFVHTGLKKINKSKQSYRISTVISSLVKTTEEYNSSMYGKFFNNQNANDYFEWNSRLAKKEKIRHENVNFITSANRGTVMSPDFNYGRPTDAISIEIDVNTIAENGDPRFSFDDESVISPMFDFALEKYNEISPEV